MFNLPAETLEKSWQSEVIRQHAAEFERLTSAAAAHQGAGQHQAALAAQHQAAQQAADLLAHMVNRLNSFGEVALSQQAYAEALAYYAYGRVLPNKDALLRRTQILTGIFRAGEQSAVVDMIQQVIQLLTAGPTDRDTLLLASAVLESLEMPWRALEYRLKGLRLHLLAPGAPPPALLEEVAALEARLGRARAQTRGFPNIIFYNLQNSGASAIYPILSEILARHSGYEMVFHPEKSEYLPFFAEGPVPLLHWTHSPMAAFPAFLPRADYKFLCLYRDPRDVVVSHAKLIVSQNPGLAQSERQLMLNLIRANMSEMFRATAGWYALDDTRCFKFSFEAMKRDIPGMLRRIFAFLELPVDPALIEEVSAKHSFEKVAKRQRGEDGPLLYNGLMHRKGIAGDWVNHFDAELKAAFQEHCGWALQLLGYETDAAWAASSQVQAAPPAPAAAVAARVEPVQPPDPAPPAQVFQVVSAPFASGVAWLINILLELEVRTTNVGFAEDHWHPAQAGTQIGDRAFNHLRWHLPVLHDRQEFTFEAGREVLWEHRLDFAAAVQQPTLLYVRDGRDALYSIWRRDYASGITLADWLRRPDVWPNHFPGLFGLPPAETWAYFNLFWQAMGDVKPVKIIRFEDMRANPLQRVTEALRFFGIERDPAAIQRAIEHSTFERAQAAMQQTAHQTGRNWGTARRGKIGEWRESYTPEDLTCFVGPADYALKAFGYPPSSARHTQKVPAVDFKEALRAAPSAQRAVEMARAHAGTDHIRYAEQTLMQVMLEQQANPKACFALANALTALQWTRQIFGGRPRSGAPRQRAFDLFYDLNQRFASLNTIAQVLIGTLERTTQAAAGLASVAPIEDGLPHPIGESYQGFNLVRYRGRYYALAQTLGPVPIEHEAFEPFLAAGTYFAAPSLAEVREQVEAARIAQPAQ